MSGLAWYCLFLLFFMFIGVPIAYSLLGSTWIYIVFFSKLSMIAACKQIITGVNSFTLLALPFFILLGEMLTKAGLTTRLVNIAKALVGHMKGALAQVNIVGSMLLAGVQGAASSDTAAVGGMLIPAMVEDGYDSAYAAVVTACSSSIGPMIPPSLTMVVLGSVSGISVGRGFLGGAIPGILLGLFMMVYAGIKARQDAKYCGSNEPFTWKALWESLKAGWMAVFIPLIVVGGIAFGVFTPTESGTFAVLATIFLGMVVYRSLSFKGLIECCVATIKTLGNILPIVAAAAAFGWILTREGAVEALSSLLLGITSSPVVLLMIMAVIYLIAGCFVETLALVILFVPIFAPIATAAGVDPVHFAVVTVLSLTVGTVTPPLGVCMYMACDIAKIKVEDFVRECIPFLIPMVVCILLVILVPAISTFLPNLLMG